MARYIDATQLQAKILDASIKNKLSESREVLKIFDKMVQDMPTADVAPKNEVAREVISDIIEILNEVYRKCDNQDIKTILVIVKAITALKQKYAEER